MFDSIACILVWSRARGQFVMSVMSPSVRESEFRNPGNCCSWNPKSWALDSGVQIKESGIPLTIENIRNH